MKADRTGVLLLFGTVALAIAFFALRRPQDVAELRGVSPELAEPPKMIDDPTAALGKTLVLGVVFEDVWGQQTDQKQYYGRIVRASSDQGVFLETFSGETMSFPWRRNSLQVAPPGEYRSYATGTVAKNPNLISMWRARANLSGDHTWTPDGPVPFPRASQDDGPNGGGAPNPLQSDGAPPRR